MGCRDERNRKGLNTPGLHKTVEELNIDDEGFGHTAYDDAVNTGKV